MIESVVNAAIEPLKHPLGWQAFAYGVLGKVIIIYGKNFVGSINPTADEVNEQTEEEIQSADENSDG